MCRGFGERRALCAGRASTVALCLVAGSSGCLDRPVSGLEPVVTARITETATQTSVKDVDLLFMIDNSASMADKQSILALAVPDLMHRLVDPTCVDRKTLAPLGETPAIPTDPCPDSGAEREFPPLRSVHIGIVSSSLGAHGAKACPQADDGKGPHNNDHGHLIARGGDDAPIDTGNGLLNGATNPNAQIDAFLDFTSGATTADEQTTFADMVVGTGQNGCGYEAQLEAPYRFLVDPEPPTGVHVDDGQLWATATGLDTVLLQQRADFLRPGSLVAVILVTDENDCSIDDTGQGYLSLSPPGTDGSAADYGFTKLRHGTSICETNPNDPCCHSCALEVEGCPSSTDDPECKAGLYKGSADPVNLRCWHQKQRYGIQFLTDVQRYVDGFTQPTVEKRDHTMVTNPLFDDLTCPAWHDGHRDDAGDCVKQPARKADLVFVAGIVGVPWQDIARQRTDSDGQPVLDAKNRPIPDLRLGFLSAEEMRKETRWPLIVPQRDPGANGGSTEAPVDPLDPLMIESITPRTQSTTQNPLGDDALPKPPDASDGANVINGHEWDPSKAPTANSDLQYACIFDLPEPRTCKSGASDCDCSPGADGSTTALEAEKNPLCYRQATGYGPTQVRAKAYPGVRELQVLQALGDQGILASICPSQVSDDSATATDYGYRPAVNAIIERLRKSLRGHCLPRTLEIDPTSHRVPCVVYEAYTPEAGDSCDCGGAGSQYPGRAFASRSDLPTQITSLTPMPTCICTIHQLTDDEARSLCETDSTYPGGVDDDSVGWCYVDPIQEADRGEVASAQAACSLVESCPSTEKRILRFVGRDDKGQPRSGSTSVVLCQEAAFSSSGDAANANLCSQ